MSENEFVTKLEEQLERFEALIVRVETTWTAIEQRTTEREKVSA